MIVFVVCTTLSVVSAIAFVYSIEFDIRHATAPILVMLGYTSVGHGLIAIIAEPRKRETDKQIQRDDNIQLTGVLLLLVITLVMGLLWVLTT